MIVSLVAAVLLWVGNVLLIRDKSWKSFVIFLVANIIWFFYWMSRGEWVAMILVLTFALQNIWGIASWRRR